MVDSSKILTVSYGTFSCTLEGFDDSFSTMKAIAEYFRDLAAGDRYFGAEPPTPDAEMLARIAEREISRRVEARSSETGIVLRASDARQVAATPPAAEVPQTTPPAAEAPASQTPRVAPSAVAAPAAAAPAAPKTPPEPVTTPVAEAATDSTDVAAAATAKGAAPTERKADDSLITPQTVADKLKRIRSVVGPEPQQDDEEDAQSPSPLAESAIDTTSPAMAPDASEDEFLLRPTDAPHPSDAADEDVTTEETTDGTREENIFHPSDPVDGDASEHSEGLSAEKQDADRTEDPEHSAAGLADAAAKADAETNPSEDTDTDADVEASENDTDTNADAEAEAFEDETDTDATAPTPQEAAGDPLPPKEPAVQDEEVAAAVPSDDASVDAAPENAPVQHAAAPVTDQTDTAAPATDRTNSDAAEQDDTDDRIQAVLRNLERVGLSKTSLLSDSVEEPSENTVPAAPTTEDALAEAEPSSGEDTDSGDGSHPRRRPRILRVKRQPRPAEAESSPTVMTARERLATMLSQTATDEEKPAEETTEPQAGAEPATPPALADTSSSLSPQDEEDLQSALAEAEAHAREELRVRPGQSLRLDTPEDLADTPDAETRDTEASDAEASAATPAEPEAQTEPDPSERTAARAPLPSTSEDEMSRLSAKAEEELASPESSRRRSAIAHLKAAVAATEAARQLGEPGKATDDGEGAFRDDLAQVVRPRRPVPAQPGRERPAPLKLVASQRVDADKAVAAEPVQPRRVPAAQASAAAGSFADYAASVGATSLQDLLEAAAAYTATVEGAEDFSRPQIMKMVETTAEEPFSREDGLRSFGTLLRQGRIEKGGNGRFQISERTRFRSEAQAANA